MIWQHLLSLSVFTSYFLAILGLFSVIAFTLLQSTSSKGASSPTNAWIFAALSIGSLIHTWFYMFKYMEWSFLNYENSLQPASSQDFVYRIASWLYNTSLFEEAWSHVVFHPLNWWWSEQLCLFTAGAWTVFVATEGTRHKVKHLWAYMLLGQIVAISVASNLFYLALIMSSSSKKKTQPIKASPRLWFSVLLSLASVAATPFTSRRLFLPNLLVMHALLFVPLLLTATSPARFSISTKALYRIIHILAVLIHLRTVLNAVAFLNFADHAGPTHPASAAWIILHSHPAQSSIGWDVIWTSLSFVAWKFLGPKRLTESMNVLSTLYLLFATPVASIGVTAPYSLLPKRQSPPALKKGDHIDKKDQ